MELIEGCNLAQLLRRRAELSVPDACELIRQAATGVHHAGEHGLIHRDIKPNNLMLSSRGEVKVLDLGLARLSRGAVGDDLTRSGAVMGTPDYMAPEQWDSSRGVDIRADVYSLGCTLHTLLTTRPPFSGMGLDSASRKMSAHLRTPPPRLDATRSDVPAGVQASIDRAMEKDPEKRFQKPMEFAEALMEFAIGADLAALAEATMSIGWVAHDPASHQAMERASTASIGAQPSTRTIDPARIRASGRPRMRVWLAVGGLVLALASAAYFSTRGGTREQNESPAPLPKAELKPKPNEWFDLLALEPAKAVWPQGKAATDSTWKYDAQNRELWIHAVERVMVRLAEVEDADFALECTINQHPWRGNIGVYFADRAEGAHHRADLVALDGFDFTKGQATIPLVRGRIDHDLTILGRVAGVP